MNNNVEKEVLRVVKLVVEHDDLVSEFPKLSDREVYLLGRFAFDGAREFELLAEGGTFGDCKLLVFKPGICLPTMKEAIDECLFFRMQGYAAAEELKRRGVNVVFTSQLAN
jgi:hypothetical protein